MPKLDLKKQFKALYQPPASHPVLVDVPELQFLMIDGQGDPSTSPLFQEAINALYTASYTLKFMLKKRGGFPDYTVMLPEALWWADDIQAFPAADRSAWKWTAMIAQPDFITPDLLAEAVTEARKRKDLPALGLLRLEALREGPSAQVMHIGPYSAEGPTVANLHAFIADQGLRPRGKHHEIYCSDPRRAAPDKLKTVIRQPVEKP